MQQGVGACEGRLRSNNRAMVMALSFNGLSADETSRWVQAFRQADNCEQAPGHEIEVELLHSDYSAIGTKSGSKRFPDSLNLVKFDGSILRTETDVVLAPGNTFVISTFNGPQLCLKGRTAPPNLSIRDLIRVSLASKTQQVEVLLKLATNITSKAHNGRQFVFRVNARELGPNQEEVTSFWGVTGAFELFAKPTASETSHESLRRQSSAHSLASLASLASLGLQACVNEDAENQGTTDDRGEPTKPHLNQPDQNCMAAAEQLSRTCAALGNETVQSAAQEEELEVQPACAERSSKKPKTEHTISEAVTGHNGAGLDFVAQCQAEVSTVKA